MKWQYDKATDYRCSHCGATGDPVSPDWRWNGNEWEHYHGYPAGHFRAVKKRPIKDNMDPLALIKILRQCANNYAPPHVLEEVDAYIKQHEQINDTGCTPVPTTPPTGETYRLTPWRDCTAEAAHGAINAIKKDGSGVDQGDTGSGKLTPRGWREIGDACRGAPVP